MTILPSARAGLPLMATAPAVASMAIRAIAQCLVFISRFPPLLGLQTRTARATFLWLKPQCFVLGSFIARPCCSFHDWSSGPSGLDLEVKFLRIDRGSAAEIRLGEGHAGER